MEIRHNQVKDDKMSYSRRAPDEHQNARPMEAGQSVSDVAQVNQDHADDEGLHLDVGTE